jgi:hypothetical protein
LRVLNHLPRPLAVVVALTVAATAPTVGHPPPEPDNGVNESTFWVLWSGDEDQQNVTANRTAQEQLVATTDVPFDQPPAAVDRWNRNDLQELPRTDVTTAAHPRAATTTDGTYLKDVGVTIAAVSPSTRARLSPAEQPLYVPPSGTVLGAVDYRIEAPEPDSGSVSWSIDDHEIESVRVLVDGAPVASTDGARTVELEYDDVAPSPTGSRTLTLAATVRASVTRTVTRTVTTCSGSGADRSCDTETRTTSHTYSETVTVTQDQPVRIYDLSISGYRTEYPDGDTGTVIYRSRPWYGVELPNGEVRGVWRYYAARDQRWDQLVVTDSEGARTRHSPVHPVQLNAYPIEPGPVPEPRGRVQLLATYGTAYEAPTLPETVELDTIEGTYTGSYGIAARTPPAPEDQSITALGLVRGTSTTVDRATFDRVPLNGSELSLTVSETTSETVTVRARLQDDGTGEPIATTTRDGYLIVDGQRANTSADGSAVVTVPRDDDAVTARYVPGHWWENRPGYVSASTTVYTGGTVLRLLRALWRIAVPVGTLLLAGFLIDRITGWSLWPPWRGV